MIIVLIGFAGGLAVGVSATGAGSLVTPLLIFHGMPSVQAVGTSLVAAAGAKFVGAGVHAGQGTVNYRLVGQLAVGSIPSAALGVWVIKRLGGLQGAEPFVERALGIVLILIAASLLTDMLILRGRAGWVPSLRMPTERPILNIAIGAAVGFSLAVTSAGSGSLVMAALLLAYPGTIPAELVGSNIFHAALLQTVAGGGHLALGTVDLGAVLALSAGYVPGIALGSKFAMRAPHSLLRPILVAAIVTTGVKLI